LAVKLNPLSVRLAPLLIVTVPTETPAVNAGSVPTAGITAASTLRGTDPRFQLVPLDQSVSVVPVHVYVCPTCGNSTLVLFREFGPLLSIPVTPADALE